MRPWRRCKRRRSNSGECRPMLPEVAKTLHTLSSQCWRRHRPNHIRSKQRRLKCQFKAKCGCRLVHLKPLLQKHSSSGALYSQYKCRRKHQRRRLQSRLHRNGRRWQQLAHQKHQRGSRSRLVLFASPACGVSIMSRLLHSAVIRSATSACKAGYRRMGRARSAARSAQCRRSSRCLHELSRMVVQQCCRRGSAQSTVLALHSCLSLL